MATHLLVAAAAVHFAPRARPAFASAAAAAWPPQGGGSGAHRMAGRRLPRAAAVSGTSAAGPVDVWRPKGGGSGPHRMAGRWPPPPVLAVPASGNVGSSAGASVDAPATVPIPPSLVSTGPLSAPDAPSSPGATAAPARPRWRSALPQGLDELDRHVLGVAVPSMVNLAVIPLVGAVDTFWVGQMGDALALAGQGAANQCFFSTYFLIAFIPTITAPLVAAAAGSGDTAAAADRVCEAIFLASALGALGTLLLVAAPGWVLGLVLPGGAPATEYATRYLRLRALSLIPALVASVGFSAYRGLLDNVTPLKVSLASNLLNLILDPLLIFGAGFVPRMGVAGAALATAAAEFGSGALYIALLLRKKMVSLRRLVTPPSVTGLLPLLRGGSAMLLRQAALNVAFVSATRRAQAMDPTGVSAAAYAITNQMYSLGLVVMLAIQATGATLVPAALAANKQKPTDADAPAGIDTAGADGTERKAAVPARGVARARAVSDRLIGWSTLIAAGMALLQIWTLPVVAPLFSTLPAVRAAVFAPAKMAALVQLTNGPLFACEGILMGVGGFGFLAGITCAGVATMVLGLVLTAKLNLGLVAVWGSLLAFHVVQLAGVIYHYLFLGPLAAGREPMDQPPPAVQCTMVPEPRGGVEVCVPASS